MRPWEYYAGTTGGGVFKTLDGGMTWTPVTDNYFGGSVGHIAVAESNPDIVYVGTGEEDIRGNVTHGDGVWKSIDAGKTWTYAGLADTRQIGRIRIHPKNPDIVYVAALGHTWGPNSERGVFKSENGGKSWRRVLFQNDTTGAVDLAMDANDPNTLYAGFWHHYRNRGNWYRAETVAGSSSPPTPERPGRTSRAIRACPPASSGKSE